MFNFTLIAQAYGFIKYDDMSVSNNGKETVFNVKVLAPPEYAEEYQKTHESLGIDLQKIREEVENQINNSVRFKKNDFKIKINLESPQGLPIMDKLNSDVCEGSITNVASLLNELNLADAASHYIVMLPCSPLNYSNVFESIRVEIPIVQHKLSMECSNRVAIFQERKYDNLMATFGNALLKILGAPVDSYSKLNVMNTGDDGIKYSITINEDAIHSILNSRCYFNILSL